MVTETLLQNVVVQCGANTQETVPVIPVGSRFGAAIWPQKWGTQMNLCTKVSKRSWQVMRVADALPGLLGLHRNFTMITTSLDPLIAGPRLSV